MIRPLLATLVILGLAACAGTPSTTPAASEEPRPAAATTALASTGNAPGTVKPDNPFPGTYMRKGPNGQTLYCRKDEVAGTRIPQEVCATEAVMRTREQEARRMVEEAREVSSRGGCNPSAGC